MGGVRPVGLCYILPCEALGSPCPAPLVVVFLPYDLSQGSLVPSAQLSLLTKLAAHGSLLILEGPPSASLLLVSAVVTSVGDAVS